MTRSIFRSLCDVWGLLIVALLVVAVVALFVNDPPPAPVEPGPAIEGGEG